MPVHVRDRLIVSQAYIESLKLNPDDHSELVLIAREITLAGARVTSRPVTIVADVLGDQTPNGTRPLGITVAHASRATDAITRVPGQIEPPIDTVADPEAAAGTEGYALTVYARRIERTSGFSRGQQGGKGKTGKNERRNICSMYPATPDNPCNKLDPKHKDFLEGPPGGTGYPGAAGGKGGPVIVRCVEGPGLDPALWRGIGGTGGPGGEGGQGGAGVGFQPPRGDQGDDGNPGTPGQDPASNDVKVVSEADWIAAVASTQHERRWGIFRRRQAAHIARGYEMFHRDGRERIPAIHDELAGANRFAADTPFHAGLGELVRDVVDENGVEHDLDIVPEVDLYERRRGNRASQVTEALRAAHEAAPDSFREAGKNLAAALTEITAAGGALVDQGNRARDRRLDAGKARTAAAASVAFCASALATALPTGQTLSFAGMTLDQAGLNAFVASLRSLVGTPPADLPGETGGPLPSGQVTAALPAAAHLALNRTRRDTTGPFQPGLPQGPLAVGEVVPPAQHARWSGLADAGHNVVVDLKAAAQAARASTGPRLAHDLLVEVVEAVRTWLLADLRVEQALDATATVEARRTEAVDFIGVWSIIEPLDFAAAMPFVLDGARVVADVLRWDTQRAERAADIYTLGITTKAPPAYSTISDPSFVEETVDFPGQVDTGPYGELLDQYLDAVLVGTADEALEQYVDRGTELARADSPSLPLAFCAPEAGPECGSPAPEVFARLRSDEEGGFWFDVTDANADGPHTEHKVSGAEVVLSFAEPPIGLPAINIELTHQGFSTQRPLSGAPRPQQAALPASIPITLDQRTHVDENGEIVREATYTGGLDRVAPAGDDEPTFPAYGRGVVAGWRFQLLTDFDRSRLRKVEVWIRYHTLQDKARVNLRRVEFPTTGLRAGATALGRITLTGPAPAGGLPVLLGSTDPTVLSLPGSVTVPEGAETTTFTATALKDSGTHPPQLTVRTADGVTRRALVSVGKALPQTARSVVLGQPSANGGVMALAVLPGGAAGSAARVFAALAPSFAPAPGEPEDPALPGEPTGPTVDSGVHGLSATLSPNGLATPGPGPRSLAVDATRKAVYVMHLNTLTKLDATTLQVKAIRPLGFGATYVAVDSAAGLVYVSDQAHGRLHIVRADDLSVVGTVGDQTTLSGAQRLAVDSASGRIFVARSRRHTDHFTSSVSLVRRRPDGTHAVLATREFPDLAIQPVAVACDPARNLVYVACLGAPGVPPRVILLSTGLTMRGEVFVNGNPHGVAAVPGSGLAYVTAQKAGGVVLIDGVKEEAMFEAPTGPYPFSVDVAADGTAYVGDVMTHTVTRVRFDQTASLQQLS